AAAADRAVALLYLRGEPDFAPAAGAPGLSLDPDRGSAAIDLPLFCGGFAESGRVDAGPLSFEIESSATLFAASLDGAPVPAASRILLALLTDVQSAGTRFSDATRTEITAWGKGLLVENRDARVELRLAPGGPPPTVWAIATSGERLATVPSSYDPETGILRFTASTSQPFGGCLFHDIIRE
ncbi:MAG: hypothetical protein IJS46_02715, partial [Kiritimatiellae bacterium]|nr:hypothetical protein [Kiritimatiellia bacterium]